MRAHPDTEPRMRWSLVNYVYGHDGCSRRELTQHTTGNSDQVGRVLRELIDAGCITKERCGQRMAHHFDHWPDDGYHGTDL
jgi:hypothetical protein